MTPPADQHLQCPLLVRTPEPDPVGQRHQVVAVDRHLSILRPAGHASVGRALAGCRDEAQNAETGQEHLYLTRQATALGDRVEAVVADGTVAVEVPLQEGRDFAVGAEGNRHSGTALLAEFVGTGNPRASKNGRRFRASK